MYNCFDAPVDDHKGVTKSGSRFWAKVLVRILIIFFYFHGDIGGIFRLFFTNETFRNNSKFLVANYS